MALFGVALGEIAELIAGYFAVEAAEVAAAEGAALLGEVAAEVGAEEILAGAVTEGAVGGMAAAEGAVDDCCWTLSWARMDSWTLIWEGKMSSPGTWKPGKSVILMLSWNR